MKFLLDTNICIYLIKQKPVSVQKNFNAQRVGDIGISSISVAELAYGVEKSQHRKRNQAALTQFLAPLTITDFDRPAALAYGQIRARLEAEGQPVGAFETLIAGQAISLGVILVTNNEREFSRIPNLRIENWTL